jgi:hypothetical protein
MCHAIHNGANAISTTPGFIQPIAQGTFIAACTHGDLRALIGS